MRTAVTVAKDHQGKWTMLSGPDVPATKQKDVFRKMRGPGGHKDFAQVIYQESDSHAQVLNFRNPKAQEEFEARRKEQQAAAIKAGEAEKRDAEKNALAAELQRHEDNLAEIERLNKTYAPPEKHPDREGWDKRAADSIKSIKDGISAVKDKIAKLYPESAKAKTPEEQMNEEMKKVPEQPVGADGLRTDGPTPEQWVEAGYDIKNYPPQGYAAKPASEAKKPAQPPTEGAAKKK